MNPFKGIDPKLGLLENQNSPFYGRFRLSFNHVNPFREPTDDRVYIKIKKGKDEALHIYQMLPRHIRQLIDLFQYKDLDCSFEDGEYSYFLEEKSFLILEMVADFIYIGMENLYFAMKELSLFLEDCHFFVYSTGDGDDRWLDEYKIKAGKLSMDRHICDIENIFGQLHFYIRRTLQYPEDKIFRRFVLYQLKDNGIFSNFLKRVKKHPDKVKSEAPELFPIYLDYKKLLK